MLLNLTHWAFNRELNIFRRYPIVRLGFLSRKRLPSFKSSCRIVCLMAWMWKFCFHWCTRDVCGSSLCFMFTQLFFFFFIFVGQGRHLDTHYESVNPPLIPRQLWKAPAHRCDTECRRSSDRKWMDGWNVGWMDGWCCHLLLRQYWHQYSVHCFLLRLTWCICQMICGLQV